MRKETKEIIDSLRAHLEYQKMMGVNGVPKGLSTQAVANGCHPCEGRDLPHSLDSRVRGNDTDKNKQLDSIKEEIGDCKRCKLCKERKNIVFGVGNANAKLMFIGEGPGADEDEQGIPFVGRAGQLLTKIIQAMGLKRDDVYIGNCVKCRPPNNRNPEPDEIGTCLPFLLKQITVIKPKIIVALGAIAAKSLLNAEVPISKIRGNVIDWEPKNINWSFSNNLLFWDEKKIEEVNRDKLPNCKLIPTYHPAFLLRNPNMKRPVWEDMQKVMELLISG